MTRTIFLVTAVVGVVLSVAPAAWAQSPDAFGRAVAARQGPSTVSIYPDAFERTAAAHMRSRVAVDTSPRTFPPDAVERMLLNRSGRPASVAASDHHDRLVSSVSQSQPVLARASSDDIAWPEIAIGFALGLTLGLGLYAAMRLTRARELAH